MLILFLLAVTVPVRLARKRFTDPNAVKDELKSPNTSALPMTSGQDVISAQRRHDTSPPIVQFTSVVDVVVESVVVVELKSTVVVVVAVLFAGARAGIDVDATVVVVVVVLRGQTSPAAASAGVRALPR
jgi:hypothetical protein